ncbi:hypothetical protein HMPREF9120_01784 [Neisseria sp. oral taxon 020 str. F0370]|nr:hypothetical protein HMPREF9120_01784 [Neisseria sp. oral taxon 020 str. F0370]
MTKGRLKNLRSRFFRRPHPFRRPPLSDGLKFVCRIPVSDTFPQEISTQVSGQGVSSQGNTGRLQRPSETENPAAHQTLSPAPQARGRAGVGGS